LIHAKRIETRNPINPNRLSTAAQATRKRPLLLKADIETQLRPEFFNTLGYERTFPLIKPMSAFPPKVDVAAFETDVHFRPNADIRCDKISV
jgi:hypothetical protein